VAKIATKKAGKIKSENVIYCENNLTWLKKFPDKCIDLIYLANCIAKFFELKYIDIKME